jgi:hypothetical protein
MSPSVMRPRAQHGYKERALSLRTWLRRGVAARTAYPRVLDELIPSALHTVEQYANNQVETDHGRLKSRL